MLLQRTLRDHAKWKTLLTQFACSAIFVEVFVLLLYLDPKNLFTEIIPKNKKYILNFFFVAIPVFVFLYIVLPFVLFRENSVITVWDWLDSFSGAWKYIRANNLLFKLNAQTTQLDNLHSVYFAGGGGAMNFTLLAFIYNCFSEIPAYAITRAVATILGFVSMYELLELTFSSSLNNEAGLTRDTMQHNSLCKKFIIMLVALIYAVLPVTPHYAFSAASLPLVILLFYHIATNQILRKKYFLFFLL